MRQDEFFAEFDQMFVDLAKRARTGTFVPNTDVYLEDGGERLVVLVELAGADADHFRIGVDERHLFIIGRRVDGTHAQRASVLQKEIEFGEFVKKIHLPVAIAYQEATATYRDGLLTISLPVSKSESLPSRRTEIRMTVRRIVA